MSVDVSPLNKEDNSMIQHNKDAIRLKDMVNHENLDLSGEKEQLIKAVSEIKNEKPERKAPKKRKAKF